MVVEVSERRERGMLQRSPREAIQFTINQVIYMKSLTIHIQVIDHAAIVGHQLYTEIHSLLPYDLLRDRADGSLWDIYSPIA